MDPRARHRSLVIGAAALLLVTAAVSWLLMRGARPWRGFRLGHTVAPLAGSQACRRCHELLYRKWATSFHGLAMRPWSAELARESLTPQAHGLLLGGLTYRAVIEGEARVEAVGPHGTERYAITQVLGGKDVFYFLTPLPRGFLQVLPVAYDVRRREWFGTAESATRHFVGRTDEPLDWRDRAYTFNTSCFSCHVSQLSTNYDPAADSYRTTWAEPGISCETCHGPGADHVKAFAAAKPGERIEDLHLVSVKRLTVEQRNDLCSSCHAKAGPLGTTFAPGERFFDHFDLATLEDADYYPDGRDLGENYTATSWRMSPCVRAGGLDCVHCHTSSGRFRFSENPNDACLPCHRARVADAAAHTHHRPGSAGSRCVACHMPTTEFARMRRSDHSMRPPAPAATMAFGSPNACNACHTDRDARWADRTVRRWHGNDAQARVLREGRLVAAAREGRWQELPQMLAYLRQTGRDEIVSASLTRLLASCPDAAKWVALRPLAGDVSPLVRAAAIGTLAGDEASRDLLVAATRDTVRLVRVRAADALARQDLTWVRAADRPSVEAAIRELTQSFQARPDQFSSHHNLGNLSLARGDAAAAAEHYRRALVLRPDHVPSLVNLSMALAQQGDLAGAEAPLREAVRLDPQSGAAHFNLGLLLAETARDSEAQVELERALSLEPRNDVAAYNLAVLVGRQSPERAAALAAQAARAQPEQPKYGWAEAFYLERAGRRAAAMVVLEALAHRHPDFADGWELLGSLYQRAGRRDDARRAYERAASARAPARPLP